MKKLTKHLKIKDVKQISLKYLLISVLLIPLFALVIFNSVFSNRIYPKVTIAGLPVGGHSKNESLYILESRLQTPTELTITVKEDKLKLVFSNIDLAYDLEGSINQSIAEDKLPNRVINLINIPESLFKTKNLPLIFRFSDNKLEEFLNILANGYSKPSKSYSIDLQDGKIAIDKGYAGSTADIAQLRKDILHSIAYRKFEDLQLNFVQENNVLNEEEVAALTTQAEKLIGKNLKLTHDLDTITINDVELIKMLARQNKYDYIKVLNYLVENINPKIERHPQNASFVFKDQRVEEFTPARDGITVNRDHLTNDVLNRLRELENSDEKTLTVTIPVSMQEPEITLNDVNNLGIKELVGRGVSYFAGSIPSRVFNVGHAATKFSSVLVKPGEEFSFNNILGDVSALTGYKQAYIIKDGRTVLGDGGGVCQVSTTLFRAVLNAGLPIIDRRAHSYRVGYYEQSSPPGIDATVFYPTTDFKFRNDSPGHLLIQSIFDSQKKSLVFEIYGTKDGRIATISKPVTSSMTAPPEDLYIDDPSLPAGQIKQIDHKAWGAKVSFNYKVERNGETLIDKTFVSNYRPWQSVFLRGTGPT